MKIFLFFFLLFTSFYVLGQCDNETVTDYTHDLDKIEIKHSSNLTFYSNNDGISGFVAKGADFKQIPIIYQGGIWMGGITQSDELKVSAKRYKDFQDYSPGPLDDLTGEIVQEDCENWNQIFEVKKSDILKHIEDFEEDGVINKNTDDDILFYPALGNSKFPEKYGWSLPVTNQGGLGPFVDRNGNGKYEALLGDYPLIKGTQSAFWIGNDLNEKNNDPFKMEFLVQSHIDTEEIELAFSSQMSIKAIYHGSENIKDFYFSLWLDADLGCVFNDQVGSLPNENIIFYYGTEKEVCLEGESFDPGTSPVLLIKHHMNENDKMSSFMSMNRKATGIAPNATYDPDNDLDIYNYMNARWLDGNNLTFGNEGYNPGTTNFRKYQYDHSENAIGGPWRACDQDSLIRDKRTLVTFGPYQLKTGDVFDFGFSVHLIENANLACPTEADIMEICENLNRVLTPVNEVNLIEKINIFPNPARDKITINTPNFKFDQYIITDMLGRVVQKEEMDLIQTKTLQVEQLKDGIYFVQILQKNQIMAVSEVVILK